MHELSATESILKIVNEEAARHNVFKVTKIKIKMGVLSDLLPECINYYFEIISKNTVSEDAVIEIEKLPLKIRCNSCNAVSNIGIKHFRCPVCNSQDLKIIGGNEFYIDSMEVE
jgi:hydrogenase nickel incorporation protein HypA/HybF